MVLNIHRRRDWRRCRQARVWLNGREVTASCWKVDGRRGRVWLYVQDADGRSVLNDTRTGVLKVEHRGHVRLRVRR